MPKHEWICQMCHHEQKPFCEPVASSAKTASIFGLVEDFVLEESPPKKSHYVDMESIKISFGGLCQGIPKVRKYDMATKSNPRKMRQCSSNSHDQGSSSHVSKCKTDQCL